MWNWKVLHAHIILRITLNMHCDYMQTMILPTGYFLNWWLHAWDLIYDYAIISFHSCVQNVIPIPYNIKPSWHEITFCTIVTLSDESQGDFSHKGPIMLSLGVLFIVSLNKILNKLLNFPLFVTPCSYQWLIAKEKQCHFHLWCHWEDHPWLDVICLYITATTVIILILPMHLWHTCHVPCP